MKEQVTRYTDHIHTGLTTEQVETRKKENLVNYDTSVPTKSIKAIIFSNFVTIFNIMNLLLALAVFSVGSYKNMFFIGIVICNTAISTIQEINSKKIIDKLSIISSTKVRCIRNKKQEEIAIDEIVLDDIIVLQTGNQIVTDSILMEGEVEVDESFITGESDPIPKKKGDMLLSGSFIVSGKCISKVEHIGNENYTSKISSEAKYIKKAKSEIMKSLEKIIKIISIAIIPVGLLLFFNQLGIEGNNIKNAVVNTVAAIIGMIPEGLVLLTSTVLAVSVIRLAKSKVLVQEIYCIETLARVDVLCLDKTGTITEGKMQIEKIVPIQEKQEEMELALTALACYTQDNNATISAIKDYYTKESNWKVKKIVPFSSQKKWSGITFEEGTYILGAPEIVLQDNYINYKEQVETYAKEYRVMILASSKNEFQEKELPKEIEVIGFILIKDKIRENAKETLRYFKEQGVSLKIISGDNPATVSRVAKQVEFDNYESYIDCTELKTEEDIKEAVEKYTIFGRVTPSQKKQIILALKEKKHTVAMTGDGVNDVLALKEADCSIAIAGGSDAAKNVAQLLLLNSNFESMPKIVAEGRRTINNIQRSASLFLIKTIYATILAILFVFIELPYPFMPIQLSLLSLVTIGIPSFILALEPNKERVKGHFLKNVIKRAWPAALTVVVSIIYIAILAINCQMLAEKYSTICVIVTTCVGFMLLIKIVRPFNIIRSILTISMIALFIGGLTIFKEIFSISLDTNTIILTVAFILIALIHFIVLNYIADNISNKTNK